MKELIGKKVNLWRNPASGEEKLNPDGERVFFNGEPFVEVLDYANGFIKIKDNGFSRWLNLAQFRTIEVA